MSLVVWARPLLATVEGPAPGDYSGFLDMTLGEGYADDPSGPLCGNPSVGFDNTRLTGDGTHEPDFGSHWSMTDTSDPEENLLHRWFTGTDASQDYGFFEVDPQFVDLNAGQVAYLECRWPALAGSKGIVDVRLRGRVWEVVDGTSAPYEINYSNQSDGWFDFQMRVYNGPGQDPGNQPSDGCSECTCGGTPVTCSCTGNPTYQLLFQITLGADSGPYQNEYFRGGIYDWAVMRPVYRVTWNGYTLTNWTRASLVYTNTEERLPQAIFSADLPGWCSMTNYVVETNPCRVEVAQMRPYTIRDRDAFVSNVEDFCDTSPYCEVYQISKDTYPPGLDSGEFGYGGLADIDELGGEGNAEQNDLVAIEFHPDEMGVPPQNIIYVVAGDDYEPNGMFVAEGLINELMNSPEALLEGEGYEPVSFAIVLGSNPDNLSWGTTHVRPFGDGEGRLWQGQMWGLETLEFGVDENEDPVEHVNNDPEAVALRAYYSRLADPDEPEDALGDQVAVMVSLHGDITPHAPTRWSGACTNEHEDYFFAPVYGIWHYDGTNPADGNDPAAFTGAALSYVDGLMGTLADYMRDPQEAGGSVYSRYIRPLSEWYPHEDFPQHNFHLTKTTGIYTDFAAYPNPEPPITVTFEFDETGLYLNKEDLEQSEQCENEIIPCPSSPDFRYCMQAYIDNMDVYRNWGKTLVWALRETFHDLGQLPINAP